MINKSTGRPDVEVTITSLERELTGFEAFISGDIKNVDRLKLLSLRNRITAIAAQLDKLEPSVIFNNKSYPAPEKWVGSPGRYRVKPENCVTYYKREYASIIAAGFKLKNLHSIDPKLYSALKTAKHRGVEVPE